MDHATFAQLLRKWRERNGYSQRDAAVVLKVSKRSLENWEQERAMPQGFGLQAMLELIQVKPKKMPFASHPPKGWVMPKPATDIVL
jgi:DNA-binding transcriptional regulator YiaG